MAALVLAAAASVRSVASCYSHANTAGDAATARATSGVRSFDDEGADGGVEAGCDSVVTSRYGDWSCADGDDPEVTFDAGGRSAFTMVRIEDVIRAHVRGLRCRCWLNVDSGAEQANVVVEIVVDDTGRVSRAAASGDDLATGACLEKELRLWKFGAGPGQVALPFHFVRQRSLHDHSDRSPSF